MVVGNIKEPTKWFSKGTRIYIIYMPGLPDRVLVIGKSRGRRRKQKTWIPSRFVMNQRVKDVYSRGITRHFIGYDGRTPEETIRAMGRFG